jgi:hypothetical protein
MPHLKFWNKDCTKSFTISPTQHFDNKKTHVWVSNEDGQGGQFLQGDVDTVIYEALEKFFKENF